MKTNLRDIGFETESWLPLDSIHFISSVTPTGSTT